LAAIAGTTTVAFAAEPPPEESSAPPAAAPSPLAGRLCELKAEAIQPREIRDKSKYRVRSFRVEYGGAKSTLPAGLPPESDLNCIQVVLTRDADGTYYDPVLHPGPEHICTISTLIAGEGESFDATALTAITSQITNAMRRIGVAAVLTVPARDPAALRIDAAAEPAPPVKPAAPETKTPSEPAPEAKPEAKPDQPKSETPAGESAPKDETPKPDAAKPETPPEAKPAPKPAPKAAADETGELVLRVYVGVVKQVRTMAMSEPAGEPRENLERHDWILRESPVNPPAPGKPTGDFVNVDALDNYVLRLNRHPGRRVDVAIAPYGDYSRPDDDAQITLDYLISEPEKNWSIYAQVSNTGTSETGAWRERFGYTNTNLTGNDDILRLDYLTSGFDQLHNFYGSYEFRINDKVRFRIYGTYSHYTASDVGFVGRNFEGESGEFGAEALYNFFQHRDWFADSFAGARYQDVYANDPTAGTSGDTNFFYPYVGATLQRDNDRASTTVTVSIEHQCPFVGTNLDDAIRLGRQPVDTEWTTLKYDVEQSFYLEPLLFPATFAGDNLDHAKNEKWQPGMTLAHEMALSLRGQYVFANKRVIPNAETVVGGFYTVRGYPEAIAVGDTSIVGSAEYRLHIPRLLRPVAADDTPKFAETGAFRKRPEQVYGKADWDLIARAFFDAGATFNNDRQTFSEVDQLLLGAGVGIEGQVALRDIRASMRLDLGFALHDLHDPQGRTIVSEGSNRVHFSFTVLF
jgi:hemolysin activation/secretion protein